jgi:uncharacterized repeat protein (TIGR03943 family)
LEVRAVLRRTLAAAPFALSSLLLAYALASGLSDALVHPRMRAWLAVAAAVFFLMGLSLAIRPPKAPLVTAFRCLPAALLLLGAVLYAGFRDSAQPQPASSMPVNVGGTAPTPVLAGAPLSDPIDFSDDSLFWGLYNRVYDEKPVGLEIRVSGFAYREKGFPKGSFLVARNLMWCCSADMALVGFLVYPQPGQAIPKEGEWVRVTGRLGLEDTSAAGIGGSSSPVVLGALVSPLDPHPDSIIYP